MKPNETPPRVTEIIGPAGAGKSTFADYLRDPANGATAEIILSVWKTPRHLLAQSFVRQLPAMIRFKLSGDGFSWREAKHIVRLDALYRRCRKILEKDSKQEIFLDEGIIFALCRMRVDNSSNQKFSASFEKKIIGLWKRIFAGIVWLDAPDTVLIERIRERAKEHRMKTKTDTEIADFLRLYRQEFVSVVEQFRQERDIIVRQFDTQKTSLAEIAEDLTTGSAG